MTRFRIAFLCLLASVLAPALAAAQSSVFVEDLTWTEVRDALKAGKTTVIIPTGGTEQNGPHMILGKHNYIVKHASGEMAKKLGNALVAPVMAYVPEGTLNPPTGHMQYAGAITLPNEYFVKVVEYAARSFKQHGFTDILLIGDSGGNQEGLKTVAEMLNKEWAGTPFRVYHLGNYYGDENGVTAWLESQGHTREEIGSHAGITDTSQLWAVNPEGIRKEKLVRGQRGDGTGVTGDATKAKVEYGRKGIEMKVEAALKQYRELKASGRK
jgi:creatinine amidohydrolase